MESDSILNLKQCCLMTEQSSFGHNVKPQIIKDTEIGLKLNKVFSYSSTTYRYTLPVYYKKELVNGMFGLHEQIVFYFKCVLVHRRT